ncbi:MAG: hypothetical protein KC470_03700 [Dehalococcoidia bacterium]|nr:hypothetical protein [Dehalococcoidia bacterium]
MAATHTSPGVVRDGGLLRPAVWVLAAAAVAELLLLRTFSRTAMHIPDVESLQFVYSAGTDLGRFAYFVAIAALVLAPGMALWLTWSRRDPVRALLVVGVVAYLAAVILTPLHVVPDGIPIAFSFGAVFLVAVGTVVRDLRFAAIAGLVVLAFGATSLWNFAQTMAPTDGTWFGLTAELATIAFAAAVPFAFRAQFDRVSLAVGVLVTLVVIGYFSGNPSTSGILLLWSGGLGGVLPGTVYAVAIGGLGATVAALSRSGRGVQAAVLLLFICSGTTLQNTYQTGLLVSALLLIASIEEPLAHGRFASAVESRRPRPNDAVTAAPIPVLK